MWVALVLARENDPDLELKVYVVNLCLCSDDILIIIIQHLYSAIMSYADTEALVAPVKSE